jgi:hypothetical protein
MTFLRSLAISATAALLCLPACYSATDTTGPWDSDGTSATAPAPPSTGAPTGQPPASPPTPGAPPAATPTDPRCPALPAGKQTGPATGNQLGRYVVKDCDGNDYALENVCGSDATWLFVAQGWCPYCRSATQSSESILASYAGKNVAAVNILVQNAQHQPPTMTDCKAWRDTYELTNVIALYDPTGVTMELFDAPSSALSVFIDKDRVIRSKIDHTDDVTAIKAGIDAALLPP